MLEFGPGIGVLVLNTPAELDGAEIDVSLTGADGGADGSGAGAARRTHSMVRPRKLPDGTCYAAVYPELPAGEYTVWRPDGRPALTVNVVEGNAVSANWPAD